MVNKGHIIDDLQLLEDIFDTTELNEALEDSVEKMNVSKEKIEKLIDENSKVSSDQVEYAKKYEKLVNSFNAEKENMKIFLFKFKIKNLENSNMTSLLRN